MSKLIIVFSFLCLISACVGQVIQDGQCDENVAVVTDFVAGNFIGVWYDIESLPSTFQTGTCNTATYGGNADGTLSVQNTQIVSGQLLFATGTASPVAGVPSGTAKFQVSINNGAAVPYWVLSTDYTTYALIYSCRNVGATQRQVNSWKLGRSKGALPTAATNTINGIISNVAALNAAASQYIQRDHTAQACSYSVEFAGACPTTVTGIANFEAARYLGTWYEFARYPQPTQTAQCSRAQYTPGTGNLVNVVNSQVENEALDTISGTAVVPGTAGLIQVSLNVAGTVIVQNLYVLATDYDNYALVYSCTNLEGNRRRVGSWQLRKNLNPLDQNAINAINAAITATPDLHAAYYQETSQTDAACFYYPDFQELPAVIELPGPCDTTITGVANFDAERYLGTWYEVARFPQPTQSGQCNRAVYSPGAATGTVTVVNSQVTGEALGTQTGTATPVPGQSGVLQVTFNVGGEVRNQNLYVLATDYDNYALAYTCTNIAGNRRQVGSWKLSKSLSPLSAEANNAINTVITATQGLRADYYKETLQTDAACFYYPKFEVLPPVIELPGPCDTSITGVANFDAARYLGTWFEVARFPQPTQTGQCNRAEYSPGVTTGTVSVLNSQVIGEALATMAGTATPVPGQSGVLQVTFNVGGEVRNQNLYVLATDYDNYALAYTCTNIAGNRRQVGSWKLSKSLSPLSAEANNAINTVITATQGLRADYYKETLQTDAACFYYPEFEVLPPVIELPGPCDTSITGVANFNAERYLGTWYEVARYPQTTQTGECNRAQYTAAPGGVSVVNSQVIGETLATISGSATVKEGQSGVLEVSLNVGGQPTSQDLYVLATDYDNFALAYTCTNIAGNRRRVGSWKLSRSTNPLSLEANNTINAAIVATQGLSQDFYRTTSQTDDACWHYLPQAGEKVIIPGQCDTSFNGVANIDLNRFANSTWYQIQRYDAVGERTCIGSKLANNEGYIDINSIEVIGEEVKKTEGVARLTTPATGLFTIEMADTEEQEQVYIVATDYDGYAIAYNCKNSGTENRQIGAWQLSRGRTMPAAGVTAVDRLVTERREFTRADTYFKTISHAGECPEPSSAFLFKSSIIVMFVCIILQFVW